MRIGAAPSREDPVKDLQAPVVVSVIVIGAAVAAGATVAILIAPQAVPVEPIVTEEVAVAGAAAVAAVVAVVAAAERPGLLEADNLPIFLQPATYPPPYPAPPTPHSIRPFPPSLNLASRFLFLFSEICFEMSRMCSILCNKIMLVLALTLCTLHDSARTKLLQSSVVLR
jgi:hypothetical protein